MKKKGCFYLLLLLSLALVIVGCGGNTKQDKPKDSKNSKVLNIYSWPDIYSPELIAEFEKKYNCKVNYDVFANNEELLAKIQAGGAQYDLIQPSDYMVATMIKLGLLEELNKDKMPNVKVRNTLFKKPPYDPDGKYSAVYTWGITGIVYNTKYVKSAPTSWADLWKPEYKGRTILLNDSREVIGVGLKKNGFSNSSKNPSEIKIAVDDVKKLAPNILAFDTDTVKQKFIAEEAWIGTIWSGDAIFANRDNKNLAFVIPKENATIWADNLAIPKGAKNKELAEAFINFVFDKEQSIKNYEAIGYINPDKDALNMHSEAYRNNPIVKTSLAAIPNSEWLLDVGEQLPLYDRSWTEIKTGK